MKDLFKGKTKIVNRTGHEVRCGGKSYGGAKSENILRVQKMSKQIGEVDGCPIFDPIEEIYDSIPEERDDSVFIVSKKVADIAALLQPERYDLIYPADIIHGSELVPIRDKITGDFLRHSNGDIVYKKVQTVVGCRKFEIGRRVK